MLERDRGKNTPREVSAHIEADKIGVLVNEPALPHLTMASQRSAAVPAWRDRRLVMVRGATLNREFDLPSAVVNHTRQEWNLHIENPLTTSLMAS